jgi:hypothetical protein
MNRTKIDFNKNNEIKQEFNIIKASSNKIETSSSRF